MSQPNRRAEPGRFDATTILILVIVVVFAAALAVMWAGFTLGSRIDGSNPELPGNPFELLFGALRGRFTWSPAVVTCTAVFAVMIVVLLGLIAALVLRARRRQSRADRAATYLARGRELEELGRRSAQRTAQRLGVAASPGIPLGRSIPGGRPLYALWEYVMIVLAGPRVGKTSALVIPAILEAPGAVITTSNKRDVVDATRDLRCLVGQVLIFDPQGIALEPPSWWWNPLTYVVDDVRAYRLAEHFASAARADGAVQDAYFEPAGRDLLAGMLLAAALQRRPITQVFEWLSEPTNQAPVDVLRQHEYDLIAADVEGVIMAPEKQRSGVYGTARQMAACLKIRSIAQWVTPIGGDADSDPRPQLDPHAFVRSSDTLYSLSREGQGSAGALVTALTAALVEAAEEHATRQPGGRLATPMLVVLDEAANVCRWSDLPDLYSHYGSRGIVILSVFQSWAQGQVAFGREGMRKLWSASNVKLYLGGISEADFLRELAELIGDYDKETSSVSYNRGVRSTNHQLRRERILDAAELAALPRGRAVMLASGTRAALLETTPWMAGPHAAAVRASIAAHDPAAVTVLPETPGDDDPGEGDS
ncbi:type IV secretory system conjugative DNA transfer family protein [Leucobacter sp. wl10]|uniref:type IV secretory system conjugative DNA transfer family protein n=1 Tax=Leucobacter sp. wl10 TaxID=2304677 RepID=UPI000E5B98FC|nr:TraM recognition domain-containing protein [Leucobacter sp. wl10]RGE19090.1 conjugal transfer protein [Leucobacter sp. wl10]